MFDSSATFAQATALEPLGDGRYAGSCDMAWSAHGPNGGYLAAIFTRAMQLHCTDPAKAPRSLTLHYLLPPEPGPFVLEIEVQREGRAVASYRAQLVQDGAAKVVAMGVLGVDFLAGVSYDERPRPEVPPFESLTPVPWREGLPPIAAQLDCRYAIGPEPFSGGEQALSGGWLRVLTEPVLDAPHVALYTDAWVPSMFTRVTGPLPVPTLDLTIHFRRRVPAEGLDPQSPVVLLVESKFAAEGYCEEDAYIWDVNGLLLAQSRQLALFRT